MAGPLTVWRFRNDKNHVGRPLRVGPDEIVELVLLIAAGRVSVEEIAAWLRDRSRADRDAAPAQ